MTGIGFLAAGTIFSVAHQRVSGLGFIGAGTIIFTGKKSIKGLTTAAGLWVTGIIGLAIGAGFYEGAFIATCLVLITQILIPRLEYKIKFSPDLSICVHYQLRSALDKVLRYCKDQKFVIRSLHVTGDASEAPVYSGVVTLRPRRSVDRAAFENHIREIEGVLDLYEVEIKS